MLKKNFGLTLLAIASAFTDQGSHQLFLNADNFIPANDSNIWYTGRFLTNTDGAKEFDWEGAQMQVNVIGATYVKARIDVLGSITGNFIVEVDGERVKSFYISKTTIPKSYHLVDNLDPSVSHNIRLI